MKYIVLFLLATAITATPVQADQMPYSMNLFGGELTSNHWEEFFNPFSSLDFQETYLAGVSLARQVGRLNENLLFEAEGQIVKHFEKQNHWEFNALLSARWGAFPWDKYVNTSVAFGIGPSWATEKPPVEVANEGDTKQYMVYWMIEFAFSPPGNDRWALITRIHHRSEAYGLVAERGGSNALVGGLKLRF